MSEKPTEKPSDNPTILPTLQPTFGPSLEPCVYDGNIYAPMHLATSHVNMMDLKPCAKHFTQFRHDMKKVVHTTASSHAAVTKAEPRKSLEKMSTAERKAFYLAHFATPEMRAKAKKTQKALNLRINSKTVQ